MKRIRFLIWVVGASTLAGCGIGADPLIDSGSCTGYPEASSSNFVLPFSAGTLVKVEQGNCGPISHFGRQRFAYDFPADPGTQIVATRSGTVIDIGLEPCMGTYAYIRHADATIARYLHMIDGSIVVTLNQFVTQGDPIGQVGATGCTDGFPHLHFDVIDDLVSFTTLPTTFRNAGVNPRGLLSRTTYSASAFTPDNN